ncbi:SGNH/GDSL hydrolase family protein [Paraburkholderia azotifigens]|uniref:SGNH/GDSL hydrolase family protein n=1 Tax=Paraburkholderia azotifigens TaxID=2057004 RepID=A0A5C6VQ84_9BURK|nr:SGNH/GDSL hydrolase family protein [Paraburkholderia azotifigens]TXC86716.1 hypothetical protein FRZ40_03465 [Paraburkholderia azotifigens]
MSLQSSHRSADKSLYPITMSREFRVLFVGNSYTTRNDMPTMLASLLEASFPGTQVKAEVIAFGGASLAAHWNRGEVQKRLTAQKWNAVVLQDQSTRALRALKSMQEHVRRFVDTIQVTGAKPYLYMTWARKNDPASQANIVTAFRGLAEATGARIIPVGLAWDQFQRLRPEIDLYESDGSHPSVIGSYLAACTHLFSFADIEAVPDTPAANTLSALDLNLLHQVCRTTAVSAAD